MMFCGNLLKLFFFQAEDGIRDFCLSRGLGDVYKRQGQGAGAPVVGRDIRVVAGWGGDFVDQDAGADVE